MNLFKKFCPPALAKAFQDVDLRLVGGCVRDFLSKGTAYDIDLVVNIPPEDTIHRLQKAELSYFTTGVEFGTVTAMIEGEPFEITSLRKEISYQGRHPKVEYTTSFQEDASRRDFTINALYVDKNEMLFDPFGGQSDLEKGFIRFIGDPNERILEDPLRILRFYRFWGKLGQDVDNKARKAVQNHIHLVWSLSKERIWDELEKILLLPKVIEILNILLQDGFYKGMSVPKITHPKIWPLTLFLSLNIDLTFHWSKNNTKLFKTLQSLKDTPKDPLALSLNYPKTLVEQVLYLRLLEGKYTLEELESHLEHLANYDVPKFPLKGSDIIDLGVPEGEFLGKILQKTLKVWEENPELCHQGCLHVASHIIKSKTSD